MLWQYPIECVSCPRLVSSDDTMWVTRNMWSPISEALSMLSWDKIFFLKEIQTIVAVEAVICTVISSRQKQVWIRQKHALQVCIANGESHKLTRRKHFYLGLIQIITHWQRSLETHFFICTHFLPEGILEFHSRETSAHKASRLPSDCHGKGRDDVGRVS